MRTEWHYVTLADEPGGLRIKLNSNGHRELADLCEAHHPEWSDTDYFLELVEDMLCNGWNSLAPEEIGALTGSPIILTPDSQRDDHGKLWHERYAVELACEALATDAGLFLQKAA